jgi:hypothetical protein
MAGSAGGAGAAFVKVVAVVVLAPFMIGALVLLLAVWAVATLTGIGPLAHYLCSRADERLLRSTLEPAPGAQVRLVPIAGRRHRLAVRWTPGDGSRPYPVRRTCGAWDRPLRSLCKLAAAAQACMGSGAAMHAYIQTHAHVHTHAVCTCSRFDCAPSRGTKPSNVPYTSLAPLHLLFSLTTCRFASPTVLEPHSSASQSSMSAWRRWASQCCPTTAPASA